MDWVRQIHFQDSKPPHEIQLDLARKTGALLRPEWAESRLVFRGLAKPAGVPYRLELHFDAARLWKNCYRLQMAATLPDAHGDSHLQSAESWFSFFSSDFKPSSASAPDPEGRHSEQYRKLAEQAVAEDAALADVAAVQRAILARMRQGATFSTAHKEGGTNISLKGARFVRADYGESGLMETFDDEAAFFAFLREFFDWEVSRNLHPDKPSDLDAWKMILVLLRDR